MFILGMTWGVFSFSLREMWHMGYGGVSSDTILNFSIPGPAGLMVTIILANLPQGFLSVLFVTYNGLFTCMLLGQEFSSYAHKSKPLRVTNRTGHQRSTYRLQIPYRYGIPLVILSSLLHWLLSQSVFLARVDTFDANGNVDTANTFSSVGYSPIAIVTVLVLGSCMVIVAYSAGFRRYKPGLPLAGPCSAAISATCHRPVDDVDAANLLVRWGVVRTESLLGHCCFTSHKISFPNPNRLYAGRVKQH